MMETKFAGVSERIETKVENRDGVDVGIVAGYLASWKPDRGGGWGVPEQFARGAFAKSLQDHRERDNRKVRLKDMHGRTIGGFPIHTMREDDRGLFGEGEINLEVQQGREAHSLARQGVLVDFSVGFISLDDKIDDGLRTIFEADLLEGSLVDEPMNQDANVLEVKSSITIELLEAMSSREVEMVLRSPSMFSKKAARALVLMMNAEGEWPGNVTMKDVLDKIRGIRV